MSPDRREPVPVRHCRVARSGDVGLVVDLAPGTDPPVGHVTVRWFRALRTESLPADDLKLASEPGVTVDERLVILGPFRPSAPLVRPHARRRSSFERSFVPLACVRARAGKDGGQYVADSRRRSRFEKRRRASARSRGRSARSAFTNSSSIKALAIF